MASPELTKQRVNPHTTVTASTPTDSPSLSPGLQNAMDTDAVPHTFSSKPGASRRHVSFPEGHGKTLAQLYEWFMALLKQHPSLEPLIREGRHRPYLMVNSWSAAYNMLVKEGFLGLTMTPVDPDARQQMVIVRGVSTTINVDLVTPEAFLWLKRSVVTGLQNAMDTDAVPHTFSSKPGASRRHVSFPEGHGKTLAQLYEWFMALLKQHPSLEPLIRKVGTGRT
ncbi:uncharacterized protein LOC123516719 [Portunus trituberculatus]|uniref:uncharacterized protein LOC123516719 n=1 Tax=Portunus trituberculatus TaxID=210409 RepID=UPI001E1CD66F|nr:uncharacterized protein LOC123516719 [Portunus trituberculatus]